MNILDLLFINISLTLLYFHWEETFVLFLISASAKTTKPGVTKKPPVTQRTVQLKDCDDDDNINAPDDETLTGKIVVQDCPCEKRFANNATRLAAVSATVATQLRAYYQKLYNTKINYQCDVKVLTGNKTHTVFTYTVKVPKSDHSKVKSALKQTCKDDEVSFSKYFITKEKELYLHITRKWCTFLRELRRMVLSDEML